jgi:hypothetical protein
MFKAAKYRRKMMTIRTLSVTIVLVLLSLGFGVASARAAPESPSLGTSVLTPLLSNLLNTANTVGDDTFSTMTLDSSVLSPPPTQHYGPYLTKSPDSGSCGNNWADDTVDRFFSVFSRDGSLVVVEQFKDGTFITPASAYTPAQLPPDGALPSPAVNMSPGACNNGGPYDGGVVVNGVTGKFVGYFIIPLAPGVTETSNDPHCDATTMSNTVPGCDTYTFITSHFSCSYGAPGCSTTTFFDHYSAPKTSTGPNSALIADSWKDASTDRGGMTGDIRST